ncbi:hypothetical protein MMC11_008618 [Xylographa trunciseda]|nr:hypothetical protein [Xylographa trunciseda]
MPPKSLSKKNAVTPILIESNTPDLDGPIPRVTRSKSRAARADQQESRTLDDLPRSRTKQPSTKALRPPKPPKPTVKQSETQKKHSGTAATRKLQSDPSKGLKQQEKRTTVRKAVPQQTLRPGSTHVAQAKSLSAQVEPWLARVRRGVIPEDSVPCETSQSDHPAEPEIWYQRWGYEPPEDQDMTSVNAGGSVGQSEVTSKGRKKAKYISVPATEVEFLNGLRERGITFKADTDDDIDNIKKMILADRPKKPTKSKEATWKTDLLKCSISDEALFQRTIMMEAIDRHKLGKYLDYMCESLWTCTRLPRKNDTSLFRLALPKPDIAVAFKLEAVFSEADLPILGNLLGVVCPESSKKEGSCDRAFPFFSMEVKGSQTVSGEPIANRQNFNNSSQALFNIYKFMRKAGRENIFLEKVRFYSAIATTSSFHVRVHRAVKVEKKHQIESDYPLGYRFDHVFKSVQKEYTRGEVSGIIKNILFEYGVKILLPILKDAADDVLEKLVNEAESQASIGKRQAEDPLESFGSAQRQRLSGIGITDPTDSQGSLSSYAVLAV